MSSPFPPEAPPIAASSPPSAGPRSVPAGNGASWWGEAWRLFTPAVAMWLLILVIMIVLSIVLSLIPVIGHLVSNLLYPVLTGGLMLGCRAIDRGQPLTINHLFAGFSERAGPLFMLGVIYLGLAIAIVATVAGILLVIFGAAVFTQMFSINNAISTSVLLSGAFMMVMVGTLLFLVLFLPLIMAIWFAPALVMLGGREPWPAMKESFAGCVQNVAPFLVYGLIGIGLAIVATIPLGLGWFVVAPMTIASIYACYCDIFEAGNVS